MPARVSLIGLGGGWTLAELLLGKTSERTKTFFVNRWTIPWPAKPLRFGLAMAIRKWMRWQDQWCERGQLKG